MSRPAGIPDGVFPPSLAMPHETWDAFQAPEWDHRLLRPWHVSNLPFGIWGHTAVWEPGLLGATTIRRHRYALVQRTEIASGYLHPDSNDSMGYSYVAAKSMLTVPLGSEDVLLVVIPGIRVDWVDGPAAVDVPSRLYSFGGDLGIRWKLTPHLALIGGVQPGWYTDMDSSRDGFRIGGLTALTWDIVPEQLTVMAGIARMDRNDFDLLPAVGVTWIPEPNTRLDLMFPRPKISRRVGHVPFLLEDWIYLSASFGGGTWAVLRADGRNDELTLADYRVSLGVERILDGGTGFNLEIGYAFGRTLEYEWTPVDIDFDPTLLIEAALRF